MSNFTTILLDQYEHDTLRNPETLPYVIEAIIPLYELYLEAARECEGAHYDELITIEEFFRPVCARYDQDPKLYPPTILDDLLALFALRKTLFVSRLH